MLENFQKRYKEHVNVEIRKVEYEVGQKMLLSVKNFTIPECLIQKFMSKFVIPFSIVQWVLKLELSPEIKEHPTFHVILLKSYKQDTLWSKCKQVIKPPPDLVSDHLEYEVHGILKCRNHKQKKWILREVAKISWELNHLDSNKKHDQCQECTRIF